MREAPVIDRNATPILATDAARTLRLDERTVRNFIRRGTLAGERSGRNWWTSRAAVRDFLDRLRPKPRS